MARRASGGKRRGYSLRTAPYSVPLAWLRNDRPIAPPDIIARAVVAFNVALLGPISELSTDAHSSTNAITSPSETTAPSTRDGRTLLTRPSNDDDEEGSEADRLTARWYGAQGRWVVEGLRRGWTAGPGS